MRLHVAIVMINGPLLRIIEEIYSTISIPASMLDLGFGVRATLLMDVRLDHP